MGWSSGTGTRNLDAPDGKYRPEPENLDSTDTRSMVTGPLSTMVFHLENIPAGSGMGTCGLVGPIGIYTAMQGSGNSMMWPGILLICFVLPAVLTLFFGALCRKAGWIKEGDLKLDL